MNHWSRYYWLRNRRPSSGCYAERWSSVRFRDSERCWSVSSPYRRNVFVCALGASMSILYNTNPMRPGNRYSHKDQGLQAVTRAVYAPSLLGAACLPRNSIHFNIDYAQYRRYWLTAQTVSAASIETGVQVDSVLVVEVFTP